MRRKEMIEKYPEIIKKFIKDHEVVIFYDCGHYKKGKIVGVVVNHNRYDLRIEYDSWGIETIYKAVRSNRERFKEVFDDKGKVIEIDLFDKAWFEFKKAMVGVSDFDVFKGEFSKMEDKFYERFMGSAITTDVIDKYFKGKK